MQILVVTPVHPMQIAEMAMFFKNYWDNNNVLSLQAMALLAEETLEKNYTITNFIYAAEARKNNSILLTNAEYKREHQIIFGNLSKTNSIKFDHVIGFTSNVTQTDGTDFDPYLIKSKALVDNIFSANNIEPIDWYTESDCEHIFPTLHHLELFLKTIGIKKDEIKEDN